MNDELTGWQSIETAPKNASNVILRVPCKRLHPDHREVIAHWASDLSGEEQPPYKGWFYDDGHGFSAVTPEPTHWRALPAVNALPELLALKQFVQANFYTKPDGGIYPMWHDWADYSEKVEPEISAFVRAALNQETKP